MTDNNVFCGWAVAVLGIRDGSWRLRVFTVGTYHEDDAKQYARSEVAREYPPAEGWVLYTATHQLRGLREVTP